MIGRIVILCCFFILSCKPGRLKETVGKIPVVIFKDTSVILGDSVRVQIYVPGYAKNPLPCIFIDTINDSATGKQPVIVENGIGYYNDLPSKLGLIFFSGTILVREMNSNKIDSFCFRSHYMVIKPKNKGGNN